MDVTLKHPWHEQLYQLRDLPLVACGGDKRPYQKGWQHESLTPEQIVAEDCAAVGLRCGEDSGIVAFDLDGASAIELAIKEGCEPYEHKTWVRERENADDRTMVFFKVPEVFWPLLPNSKTKTTTREATDGEKGEQLEVFWGNRFQVIVAGKHPSGVFYDWVGTSPADLKPLPPEWLAFWLKLAEEDDDNSSTAVVKRDREPNGGTGWTDFIDCDICGRNKQDCRITANGELVLCKHGNSFHPPTGLKKNQVIEGATKKWRFNGIVTNDVGTFSRFILDALPAMPKQSQGALRQTRKIIIEPDMALELLPERMGNIGMNIRSQRITTEQRGELTADDVQRLYVRLCNPEEKWTQQTTADCMMELAMENQVDPVKTWLESITADPLCDSDWENLDQFLLGKKDEIAKLFFRRYLVAAVKRIWEPGCVVRQTPVLQGPQNLGKTQTGKAIFSPQWFGSDGLSKKLNHDDVARMMRFWCFELGELDGYRKHDAERLKNFLTNSTDTARFVYNRAHRVIPRRSIFWGTSNGIPLNDPTGSTRFVVIPVETELPWENVALAREPLLARAVQEYRNGAPSFSTADEMDAIRERNSDFQTIEPWFDVIQYHAQRVVTEERLPVTNQGLLNAIGFDGLQRVGNRDYARITNVMTALGFYHKRQKRVGDQRLTGWWPVGWFTSTASNRKE